MLFVIGFWVLTGNLQSTELRYSISNYFDILKYSSYMLMWTSFCAQGLCTYKYAHENLHILHSHIGYWI